MLGLRRKSKEAQGSSAISADLAGAVISGQVAVGENIVQIHAEHGAIVNYTEAAKRPTPRLRKLPVSRLPRDFANPVGRDDEIAAVGAALESGMATELHGPSGIGKSALLRHLAHHGGQALPDGVVHTSAAGLDLTDVGQFVFEAFYESGETRFIPSQAELQGYLGDRRALLILDDLGLERDDLERLLDTAPAARFLLAAQERHLWGGQSLSHELGGLDERASLALVEGELGRSLGADERADAAATCAALKGHPLRVIRAAALVREGDTTFAELARAEPGDGAEWLDARALAALSPAERELVGLVTALPGLALREDHIAAIAGIANAPALLASLEERGLIQSHSPRYSLAGTVTQAGASEARQLRMRALSHLVTTVESEGDPRPALPEAQLIVGLVESEPSLEPREVIRAAHAVDAPLALTGRWGAWSRVLRRALDGAERSEDVVAEGWATHQLGSRALCLGAAGEAETLLSAALRIREALGDERGAEVTRHNLGLLRSPPSVDGHPGDGDPGWWVVLAVGAVLVAAAAGVFALTRGDDGSSDQTPAAAKSTRATTTTPSTTTPSTTTRQPLPTEGASIDPTAIDFGEVPLGKTDSRTVTVTNPGSQPLTLGTFGLESSDTAFDLSDLCGPGRVLQAGEPCTVEVSFAPGSAEPQGNTLILSDDGNGAPVSIPISGTGVEPPAPPPGPVD